MQVPLGIITKGEQKYDDMLQILDELYKYVPAKSTSETVSVPVNGKEHPKIVHNDTCRPIAFGKC